MGSITVFIYFIFAEWEKPRDWLEYERSRGIGSSTSTVSKPSCDSGSRSSAIAPTSSSSQTRNQPGDQRQRDDNPPISSSLQNSVLDRLPSGSSALYNSSSVAGNSGATSNNFDYQHYHHYNRNVSADHHRNSEDLIATNNDMDLSSLEGTPTSETSDNHQSNHQLHHPHQHMYVGAASLQLLGHSQMSSNSISGGNATGATNHNSHFQSDMSPYSADGPPTPTHSEQENQDNNPSAAPTAMQNSVSLSSMSSVSNAAGNLSQVVASPLTALKPQPPSLTPSLAKLYRESLIGHVTGWPAEAVEKACQRINDEHQNLSNLAITRVSAELKMARSLVRLAEIQATLQEQRILFLRQESYELEAMTPRSGLPMLEDTCTTVPITSTSSSSSLLNSASTTTTFASFSATTGIVK